MQPRLSAMPCTTSAAPRLHAATKSNSSYVILTECVDGETQKAGVCSILPFRTEQQLGAMLVPAHSSSVSIQVRGQPQNHRHIGRETFSPQAFSWLTRRRVLQREGVDKDLAGLDDDRQQAHTSTLSEGMQQSTSATAATAAAKPPTWLTWLYPAGDNCRGGMAALAFNTFTAGSREECGCKEEWPKQSQKNASFSGKKKKT